MIGASSQKAKLLQKSRKLSFSASGKGNLLPFLHCGPQ
jgi:hypothetical protein